MSINLSEREIILFSVVALIENAPPNLTASTRQFASFLKQPVTVSTGLDGTVLMESSKSQLNLRIGSLRAELQDLSGLPLDQRPLMGHLREAINFIGGSVKSIGMNVQLSVPVDDSGGAGLLIATHLLHPDRHGSLGGATVRSFQGRVTYELDDGSQWNVRLEPRFGDIDSGDIFVDLNHSISFDPPIEPPLTEGWVEQFEPGRMQDFKSLHDWLESLSQ